MDEHQLRRAVLLLLRCLLLAALGQVPHHYAPIRGSGRNQVARLATKLNLVDVVFVLPQAEQFCLCVPNVPYGHAPVYTARTH